MPLEIFPFFMLALLSLFLKGMCVKIIVGEGRLRTIEQALKGKIDALAAYP